ncbi:MAG: cytochrome c biogenesis protein CcsA [Prevotellaceae bacterium]|nr:cytochrome c biogenesis protein CcsA [Candidatus Minthosoma caballi]
MRKLPFIALAVVAVAIAVATFVEDATSTEFASENIYGSPWFACLWGIVVLGAIPLIVKRRLWKRVSVGLLHLSFITILAGALTTHIFGEKYMVHLREGEQHLALRLDSFSIRYYPGSDAPQDFVSHCTLVDRNEAVTVSMNKPLEDNGYRFYQTSYDYDLHGTVLTVNHDPWGVCVTYIGYLLLAFSSVWLLLGRGGEIGMLMRRLKERLRSSALMAAVVVCGAASFSMSAEAKENFTPRCMEKAQADSLKNKQIMYNNRICPLNTLARDFTKKLTGKPSFRGLSAEQVLMSWMLYPEDWQKVDMIKIKDEGVKRQLGIKTKLAAFEDFFDKDGNYILLGQNHADIDEKVGLILWLNEGTLIQALPDGTAPLPVEKIQAEIIYNEVPATTVLFCACLTAAIIAIAAFVVKMAKGRLNAKAERVVDILTTVALYGCTLLLVASIGLRWYISGTVPLTNGLETMQFIALIALTGGCITAAALKNANYIKGGAMLIAGFTLLVAHLSEMNPQITPLMPVLHSPWLSSHVSIIMISYALFAFMAINSATFLCIRKKSNGSDEHVLTTLNRLLLYPATLCLSIGIFLGAVWANQSWGTYWSWDPKEAWALISMLAYGIAFHRNSLPWLRKEGYFHIYLLLAFLTILMTYFGVNYLLGGMHSYANG